MLTNNNKNVHRYKKIKLKRTFGIRKNSARTEAKQFL